MIRTHVRLDKQQYEALRRQAHAEGISIAESVRRAIRVTLRARAEAPWMRFAGFVESGDANSSQAIDAFVYGTNR